MKFVVRVDDCGWTPDKRPDAGLKYFREWFHACNLDVAPYPVVLAFIPATMTVADLDDLGGILRACDSPGHVPRLAVHGWDHEKGAIVEAEKMAHGLSCLEHAAARDCFTVRHERIYVPPFNAYTKKTLLDWSRATSGTNSLFLGGFRDDSQSVDYGPDPVIVRKNVIHVPAVFKLYARAPALVEQLGKIVEPEIVDDVEPAPVVLTLHITWDDKYFAALGELFHLIGPSIVPPESFRKWLIENNRTGGGAE